MKEIKMILKALGIAILLFAGNIGFWTALSLWAQTR